MIFYKRNNKKLNKFGFKVDKVLKFIKNVFILALPSNSYLQDSSLDRLLEGTSKVFLNKVQDLI